MTLRIVPTSPDHASTRPVVSSPEHSSMASAPPAVPSIPFTRPTPLALACQLSLEVEILAETLYTANSLVAGEPAPAPFNALPAVVRSAYRTASIIALQRLVPSAHARAVAVAEAIVPGFTEALAVYCSALTYAPARPEGR